MMKIFGGVGGDVSKNKPALAAAFKTVMDAGNQLK